MQNITLHIAGIYILIQSEIKGVIDRFQEFYKHFTVVNAVTIDYKIVIKQKNFTVSTNEEDGTFKFQGYSFRQLEKHAILLIPSIKNAYQYSEDFFLFIFSELCIEKNKLIFHSASLLDDQNNAYIFFGPSGVGKSTISKKLSNFTTFSDDMVVIEKRKNGYLLQKTPFERNKQNSVPELVQIKGLYRLIQSDVLKTKLLTKSMAFNVLLSNLWFSEYKKEHIEKYTTLLKNLIEDIPVAELHTTKDNLRIEIIKGINII